MPGSMLWETAKVEAAFVEAATDSSRWTAAMDAAAAVTGGAGALLLPIRGRLPNVPFSESIGELFESYFRDGWYQRDERYRGIGTMVRRGAFGDLDFISADEIATNAYYQEFHAAHGFRWFGGVKIAFGDDLWVLAIQRTIAQGPFTPEEIEKLAKLSPQLSTAGSLARALGFARVDAALAAFEASGSAVILLNLCGEVVRANQAAERLLGPHLGISQKRLVCRDPDKTKEINAALHRVLWSASQSILLPPVSLPRGEKRPLIAYPLRLAGVSADALAPCQAVVVLIDLETQPRPPENVLQSCFGLTMAEARVARQVASGQAVDQVAEELGIARETARHQLKSIFAKMGVHRQSELVRILAQVVYQGPREQRDQ
jgi:DNA-binding CsgD family transcriptional regulator/PAS domain-containing protein